MPKHLWMQDLSSVAYCPKCKALAFKRSNTKSGFERLVRQYSTKVPFRCHSCGYRALIDQNSLRYPVGSQQEFESHEDFDSNIKLPDIQISKPNRFSVDHTDGGARASSQQQPQMEPLREPLLPETKEESAEMPIPDGSFPSIQAQQQTETDSPAEKPDLHDVFPEFDETDDSEHPSNQWRNKEHRILCPSCGEYSLYRSHSRTMAEAIRKKLTSKRTYRCHKCNWRGWLPKNL